MVEAGNPEATWIVQVVVVAAAAAPTEIHMMVTVRYNSMSVMTTDNHCGTKKSCTNNQPNHTIDYRNLQSQDAAEETAFQSASLSSFLSLCRTPSLQSKLHIVKLVEMYDHWHLE